MFKTQELILIVAFLNVEMLLYVVKYNLLIVNLNSLSFIVTSL